MSATLHRTTAPRPSHTATRHLLVIDDGDHTLRTGLRWARHHLGSDDRVTVIATYSHLHIAPFSAECPAVFEGLGDAEEAARDIAEQCIADVFGHDEPGDRVQLDVRSGYAHRVARAHLCESTDVVIARSRPGRWHDRLTPSPARRLAGRTARPLIIVPHDWEPPRP